MKYLSVLLVLIVFAISYSCSEGQGQSGSSVLPAAQFEVKIKEFSAAPLIDVRTPGEFEKGHIKNAVNIDINNSAFETEIGKLDKSKPVFVYCLSGARSGNATRIMKNMGFKTIYDLEGGMMQWRNAGFQETTGNTVSSSELNKAAFEKLLENDKLVLIDFYADWCAPCKKMAPFLEEMKKELADKVEIIRINADENKTLAKELKVEGLPTILLYKKKSLVWSNMGFISKEDLVKQLKGKF